MRHNFFFIKQQLDPNNKLWHFFLFYLITCSCILYLEIINSLKKTKTILTGNLRRHVEMSTCDWLFSSHSRDPLANHSCAYVQRAVSTWRLSEFAKRNWGVNKLFVHNLHNLSAFFSKLIYERVLWSQKMSGDGNKKQFWKRNTAKVPGKWVTCSC